jgi:hypothetical protein
MISCFSGKEIPAHKLLILYYPPSHVHFDWDKSVYAAARAGEALEELTASLRSFRKRHVLGRKPAMGFVLAAAGVAVLVHWAATVVLHWPEASFFSRYIEPLFAGVLLLFARFRLGALTRRRRRWKQDGRETVNAELKAIQEAVAQMPDDPSAEQAAAVLRRRCPDVISEIAFDGTYFRAFTYMDFLFYPQLKHPSAREELPTKHSLNRDAYYVGNVVYDGWRLFHKDQPELVDPRFVGSGGRRGVI